MATMTKLLLALLLFQLAATAYSKQEKAGAKPGNRPHVQKTKPGDQPKHTPTHGGKKQYCVKGPDTSGKPPVGIEEDNQEMFDTICGEKNPKVKCEPAYTGGPCGSLKFEDRLSYVMNALYVAHGRDPKFCQGVLTTVNPSKGKCVFE